MIPILVAGPAVEPVTLEEMRAYLRLDGPQEDDLVTTLIKAARLLVEAQARLILIEQSWRLVLDRWPADRILRLPLAPIIAVDAISLLDGAGTVTVASSDLYRVEAAGDPARIVLGAGMPDPVRSAGGIRIDLRAGFGTDPTAPPAPPVQAVRLLVARWFENRGDAALADGGLPSDVAALIGPYRRLRLV